MVQNGLTLTEAQTSQRDLADILREKGWKAKQPLVRHLLVFGEGKLEASVSAKLRENGWRLQQANSLKEAAALCEQYEILAGLALLPSALTDDGFGTGCG